MTIHCPQYAAEYYEHPASEDMTGPLSQERRRSKGAARLERSGMLTCYQDARAYTVSRSDQVCVFIILSGAETHDICGSCFAKACRLKYIYSVFMFENIFSRYLRNFEACTLQSSLNITILDVTIL